MLAITVTVLHGPSAAPAQMCHSRTLSQLYSQRRRYQTSAAQYILPELRSDIVELECDPNDGLKFDDEDDEVSALLKRRAL